MENATNSSSEDGDFGWAFTNQPISSAMITTWIPVVTEYLGSTSSGEDVPLDPGFLEPWPRIGGVGVAAILTSLILVGTALGNILVCLAICLERRLHNMTNYFLMSLAVTDLMVAVSVMPLGIITINEGYFPLPSICCLTWVLLDVLFCTCSIMHLCTISVDRYLSLRYPIKYGRIKTKRRVVLKICFVWILSVAMSLPIVLLYVRDEQFVFRNGACALQDPLYVTIGSIVCFYIPLAIMLATYALTVHLLNEKAIEVQRANKATGSSGESGQNSGKRQIETTFSRQPSGTSNSGWRRILSLSKTSSSSTVETEGPSSTNSTGRDSGQCSAPSTPAAGSTKRSSPVMVEMRIPVVPLPARKEVHAVRKYSVKCRPLAKGQETAIVLQSSAVAAPDHRTHAEELWLQLTTDSTGKTYRSVVVGANVKDYPLDGGNGNGTSSPKLALQKTDQHKDQPITVDDAVSLDNESSLSTTSQSFRDASSSVGSKQDAVSMTTTTDSQPPHHPRSPSQPCMRKWAAKHGRFLRAERKATKVLGVVFFTFVVLWSPFFLLNLLSVCKECVQSISPRLQDIALWLGYASSMVNPIFYTVFNKTFRQTFAKILKCQWKQIK